MRDFLLSGEAWDRRRLRDRRDRHLDHGQGACAADHGGLCHECLEDQVSELADYADRQRRPEPGEDIDAYSAAHLPGCMREGWLLLCAYLQGEPYALDRVAQARIARRRCCGGGEHLLIELVNYLGRRFWWCPTCRMPLPDARQEWAGVRADLPVPQLPIGWDPGVPGAQVAPMSWDYDPAEVGGVDDGLGHVTSDADPGL